MTRTTDLTTTASSRSVCALGLLLLSFVAASPVAAICDVIPQVKTITRGAMGGIDRPFASPGDPVELSVDTGGCDSAVFADDVLITFLFKPQSGSRHAVVVSSEVGGCQAAALAQQLEACEVQLDGGHTTCVEDPSATGSPTRLSLSFPDTQGVDESTPVLTGPVAIAVTPNGEPLPCGLATQRCAAPGAPSNLLACIDELYAYDGTCSTAATSIHRAFGNFTALPPPNLFMDLCTPTVEGPECSGLEPVALGAVDANGNLLFPTDTLGIQFDEAELPTPRLVVFGTTIEAREGAPGTIDVPGPAFFDSYSTRGQLLPPFLQETEDPLQSAEFLGTVDARRGVTRLLRRSPVFQECRDLQNDPLVPGVPCTEDSDCPLAASCRTAVCYDAGVPTGQDCGNDDQCPGTQECGPSLFDVGGRLAAGGAGPLQIEAADYHAFAGPSVSIDCLFEGDGFILTCRSEPAGPAPGQDINGDGDSNDSTVVTILSSETGETLLLNGNEGAAAARVQRGVFTTPSIAVEGDVFAYLETEADEGAVDQNADGDVEDSFLRVYRVEAGALEDLLLDPIRATDEAPEIDGMSLTVSDGIVFYRESEIDGTARMTPQVASAAPILGAYDYDTTPDGRFFVYNDLFLNVYLHDRDADEDGFFDEPNDSTVQEIPVDWGAIVPSEARVSDDGRWVVFDELVDGVPDFQVFAWDRLSETKTQLSLTPTGAKPNGPSRAADISGDGRYVVFESEATDIAFDVNPNLRDIVLHDRDSDEDGIFDERGVDGNGVLNEVSWTVVSAPQDACAPGPDCNAPSGGNCSSLLPAISGNGRWITFSSCATNMVTQAGPDTNDAWDIFLAEVNGSSAVPVQRISLIPDKVTRQPVQLDNDSTVSLISRDGRFVAFRTFAKNLPVVNPVTDWVLTDLDPDENGIFEFFTSDAVPRFSLKRLDFVQDEGALRSAVGFSSDGRYLLEAIKLGPFRLHDVVTRSVTPVPISGPINQLFNPALSAGAAHRGVPAVFQNAFQVELQGIDSADLTNDLNGDGDVDDFVLYALDTDSADRVGVQLGVAASVSVTEGSAVYLDGQGRVLLWRNRQVGPPLDLGLIARRIDLTSSVIAALVAEEDAGSDLNGDADLDDWVLHVNDLATASPGSWINTQQTADLLAADGDVVAFRSRNPQTFDRLALYDFQSTLTTHVDEDVRDVVAANGIVAFRSSEEADGVSLNSDDDTVDEVLQVFDRASSALFNTRQAAVPCRFAACRQEQPYRIDGETVLFLTREEDQSGVGVLGSGCRAAGSECDLDGDGDGQGLVLQRFNVATMRSTADIEASREALPSATSGICTDTAAACNEDDECPAGVCFVPPGGCLRATGQACIPPTIECESSPQGCVSGCTGDEFCAPTPGQPGVGSCVARGGACDSDDQCLPGEFCSDEEQAVRFLADPLRGFGDDTFAYTTTGSCVDGTGNVDSTCLTDADCAAGFTCAPSVILAGSGDADRDGVADTTDNCGSRANSSQLDLDGDGIGDACDLQTCGDGVQSYGETCDDGNQSQGDGCDDRCLLEIGFEVACSNGLDDDGDGLVDAAQDGGCGDATDPSERDADAPCDDGVDNDGDGLVDFPADPGCPPPSPATVGATQVAGVEDPACSDGIDNDGDGLVDWNGGPFATPPDPHCAGKRFRVSEQPPRCGVGPASAVALLAAMRARRWARHRR